MDEEDGKKECTWYDTVVMHVSVSSFRRNCDDNEDTKCIGFRAMMKRMKLNLRGNG